MRFLIALTLFALALLGIGLTGTDVRAQLLPPLPDATRILPPLPELDTRPLIETAGEALERARLDRITDFLDDHRGRVAPDRNGQPAVRGVLVATGVDAAMIARAAKQGFALLDRERIDGLDLEIVRFRIPDGRRLARAQQQLARLLPDAAVDVDHIYFTSGAAAPAAILPTMALATTARSGDAALGLIDGGVAAHPSVAGRVEQRGFATGAPRASRHGTAVASLLIGSGAVRGAAPGARLLAADVYGSDPAGGNASAIIRALGWLAKNDVAVTTISLVGPDNKLLDAAISRAQQRGMLIVAAVGNDGPAAPPAYPAAYRGVLAVTGVDEDGDVLPEAGRAVRVDFAAPGADIRAATGRDDTDPMRGTSFAAPLVAGRLVQHYPAPSIARIGPAVRALIAEARDLGKKGRDKIYGHGLVCAACGGG